MTESLKRPLLPPPISGAGGGGKGGRGGKAPREDKNDLQARSTARIIDLISEGQIVGLVDGAKSIYFDDTPLQSQDGTYNFEGVEWAESTGTPDQGYIPGFGGTGNPVPVGTEIKKSGTGPVVRVINSPDIDAIRITFRVPMFAWMQNDGDIRRTSVELAIDVQPSGGSYTEVKTVKISGKTLSPYERSVRVDLPKGGAPWSVRVRRLTDDATESSRGHHNKTFWASYTELIDAKFTYPHSAVIGLTVDAEEFGSSIPTRSYDVKGLIVRVPSNYDPENRTYNGTWNGQFKLAWTNNPAWVFYDLATNPRYGLGEFLSDSQVDKWALYQIAQYCDQLVPSGFKDPQNKDIMEPRFVFNGVINNQEEAFRVLQAIASAFRGMSYFATGAITVVADQPRDPIKVVAPADVIGGEFTYSGTSLRVRHTVAHVVWNDPDDNYRTAVEVVEAPPEYITRYGYREKRVIAYGCTSRGQAHRFGKWIIYSELHETETVTYQAAWDHIDIVPGDIIKVFDPSYAGVRFGGRIKSVSGNRRSVTLDAPVTLASGETYRLVVTMPDGTLAERNISNSAGTHTTVSLSAALPDTPVEGAMFGIVGTDIEPRQFRVLAIRETEEGNFEVTALLHHPGKFAHVEQGVQLPPLPYQRLPSELEPPGEITAQESMTRVNGLPQIRLTVSWVLAQDPLVRFYEAQVLVPGGSWQNHTPTRLNSFDMITEPGLHVIRVRSGGDNGKYSNWVTKEYTVVGEGDAPPKVENVNTFGGVKQITVTWAPVSFSDVDYEVWAHSSLLSGPASNIIQNATRVGVVKGTTFTHVGLNPVAERWYWVRAVTFGGTPGPFSDAAYGKTELIDDDDFVEAITELFEDLELRAPEPVYELPGPGSPMRVDGKLVLYVPEKRLYYWDESQQEWLPLIADIEEGQVQAAHIAANTIGQTHFADNLKPIGVSNGLPDPATWDGPDTIVNEQDGGLYYLKDGEWITAVPDVDLDAILVENKHIVDGAVDTLKLAANAVTSAKIATGAVLEEKLADAAVTARKIAHEALNATHFAQGLNPVQVVDSLPDPATWDGSNTVVNREDDGLYYLKDGEWVANAPDVDLDAIIVENKHIVDGAVDALKLAANAVTSAKIATGAVLEDKLADAAVTAGKIAANAVSTENLQDELITAEKLVANAVTEAKLAASAVTERHLANASVTAEKIRDEAIDATKFARNIAAPQIVSSLPVFAEDAKAVALTGESGTYASTPHSAAVEVGQHFAVVVKVAPKSTGFAVSNFVTGSGGAGWAFGLRGSTSVAMWVVRDDGSPAVTNLGPYLVDGADRWLAARVLPIPDGGYDVSAFISEDGVSWTLLGNSSFGPEVVFGHPVELAVGGRSGGVHNMLEGQVYYAALYDGSGFNLSSGPTGTLVAEFNPEDAAFDDTSFVSSSTGETWTLHGNARIVTENQGKLVTLQSDGKLYRYDQGQWTAAVPTTDLSGLIEGQQLVDEAITAAKLAAEAVEAANIKDGAVVSEKLAEAAVVAGKIAANAIITENLQDELITAEKIVANAVTQAKIAANAVTEAKIANNAITARQIANGVIGATKFASDIAAPQIVSSLPTSGNYEGRLVVYQGELHRYHNGSWTTAVKAVDVAGQLTNEQIAEIEAAKVSGQITETQISDAAITTPKLAAGSVVSDKVAANAIVAAKIAANAITASKIASNAVEARHIVANSITAGAIAAGAVGADQIAANAITADKIAGNTITASKLVVTDTSNLVPDAHMEDDDAWWHNDRNAFSLTTPDLDVGSRRAILFSPISGTGYGNRHFRSRYFPVKPGEPLLASIKVGVLHDGTNLNVLPRVHWRNAAGVEIGYVSFVFSRSGASAGDVFTVSREVTPPADARSADLRVYTHVETINHPIVIGGLTIRPMTGSELIVDGAVTAEKITANAINASHLSANAVHADHIGANTIGADHILANAVTSEKILAGAVQAEHVASNAITTEKLTIGNFSNLLDDPGFDIFGPSDTGNPRTYANGGGQWTRSSLRGPEVRSGDYADKWVVSAGTNGGNNARSRWRWTRVTPGETYVFGVWVSRIGEWQSGDIRVALGWSDSTGSRIYAINGDRVPLASLPEGSEHRLLFLTDTAPAGAALVECIIVPDANPTASTAEDCAVVFDDAFLTRVSGSILIEDGAITAEKIVANAITSDKIASGAVIADHIRANAVDTPHIRAGAVDTPQINANAITSDKILANAITSDKIHANAVRAIHLDADSVTAGAIKAGAVGADQIAANAISSDKILAGSITAEKLTIGFGKNLLHNASFTFGLDGWANDTGGGQSYGDVKLSWRAPGLIWSGLITPVLQIRQVGDDPTGWADVRAERPDAGSGPGRLRYMVPATAGEWFEASVHVSAHRCTAQLRIECCGADGTVTGYIGPDTTTESGGEANSQHPDNWPRLWVKGQLPAGTVGVGIHIRKRATSTAGAADSVLYIHKPFLARTVPNVTEPSDWSDGGVIQITSGGIVANAVLAEHITANAIQTNHIASGSVVADTIAANAITTQKLAANAVTAAKIAAGTITGNEIAGRTIAGDKLIANTITAGEIATNAVIARHIQANAVTAVKIAANAVTTQKLEANAVTAVKIAANAVTTQKLEANAVVAAKIASNAVEARHLTANSITAGAIAAGAVGADQIAANAISSDKIAAGSIVAEKLAVGFGKNLLHNASFTFGLDGWEMRTGGGMPGGEMSLSTRMSNGSNWGGHITPVAELKQSTDRDTGYADFVPIRPDGLDGSHARSWPCTEGEWFEASLYASTHRCQVELRIRFIDASGAYISSPVVATHGPQASSNGDPEKWPRLWGKAQAPAGAVGVTIHIRKWATIEGSNSYLFIHKPMLARTHAEATVPADWSDGGVIQITSGGIVANAVLAEHITANAITGSHISANAIAAVHIAAGAVNASSMLANNVVVTGHINANAITAQKINSNAIVARHIQANAVEAGHIKANAIETGHISSGAVNTQQLAANAVTAGKVAANAITAVKIAAGAVTADKLAVNSVTAGAVAAGAIAAAAIQANAVVASKIASNAIQTRHITANSIRAQEIAANTIRANNIYGSAVNGTYSRTQSSQNVWEGNTSSTRTDTVTIASYRMSSEGQGRFYFWVANGWRPDRVIASIQDVRNRPVSAAITSRRIEFIVAVDGTETILFSTSSATGITGCYGYRSAPAGALVEFKVRWSSSRASGGTPSDRRHRLESVRTMILECKR